MALTKVERRIRIKRRIRKVIFGTAERPRLSVYRSNTQISAQLMMIMPGKLWYQHLLYARRSLKRKVTRQNRPNCWVPCLLKRQKQPGLPLLCLTETGIYITEE